MLDVADLIPELGRWNNGKGVSPDAWFFIEGRADHALAFCTSVWPEFVEFESYVLRGPLDLERLRGWEHNGDLSRQQIETAMNAYLLDGMFPQDEAIVALKTAQCERLASIMADMLGAKLARDFPQRRFSTFVLGGNDFGISFHQL